MFITEFMIGGMSAIISRTLTAPLELYKTQRQNYFIPDATIRSVLRKEGIRYLWKGNYTNCIRAFPQFAITNGIYVKTNDCMIVITHLQFPNKNVISASDAFNAYKDFFEN